MLEWDALEIGGNRLIIGIVKRVHVRDELIDPIKLRIRTEGFSAVGRMSSLRGIAALGTGFEMIHPA